MNPRARKLNAVLAVIFITLFVMQPLSGSTTVWAKPVAFPYKCDQSTIILIPDTVTILSPLVTNRSATGCQISGKMRVQLAGNDVKDIPVTGQVDYYDKFKSSSIGYFELEVAGLTLKALDSTFDYSISGEPTLTITNPKIKIPDSWGGLEATVPKAFTIDEGGLKGYTFSLPAIETKKFSMELWGDLGLSSLGYYITAHGAFMLPDIGKTKDCYIKVDVTLYVDALGNTVMEINTPSGAQAASLAADRSEIALPNGLAKLIPASMPLHSSYLSLPESLPDEVVAQLWNPAPEAVEEEQATGLPGAQTWTLPKAQTVGVAEAAGYSPDDTGLLQDISYSDQAPEATVPAITQEAPAQPENPDLGWGGLDLTASYQCMGKGIPVGTTGFELTGVVGRLTLLSTQQAVSLQVTLDSMVALPVLDIPLLTVEAGASFQWSPEFAGSLRGVVTVLSMFEAGGAEISMGETDGLRLTVWFQSLWPPLRADFALHAWNTDVSSCTNWQTVCYEHAGLPPTCTSTCGNWKVETKFHFTGSAACELGMGAGALLDTPGIPYPCHWRWCKKWWGGYPCFSWCKIAIKIPPVDLWLAGASTQFGEFTGGLWGLKGSVHFLVFTTGFYFDHKGNLDFGDVSSYKLVDSQQLQEAYRAYQAAALRDGPQAAFPGDDTFSFPSENQVDINFDLPLPNQLPLPLGVTDVITRAQVITQTDTVFSVKADVPLDVTLTSPDGFVITPENHETAPGGYVVDYTQVVSTEMVTQNSSGSDGRWRFIPASSMPALETVDVKLDAVSVFSSTVGSDEVMNYTSIPPGVHTVQVAPLSGTWPTLSTTFNVITGTDYTVLAIGADLAELLVLEDDQNTPASGSGALRVVNVADNARSINLNTGAGSVQGLGYQQASGYLEVPAGTYSVTVASPVFSPALAATLTETGSVVYGDQVASAGDVNGDGYDDVLAADNAYDSDRGRVHLYLGSPAGPQKTASWIMTGEAQGDHFGISITGAGDVNHDGYDDVLVGAYGYTDPDYDERGKVYLYYGSQNGLNTTAAWSAVGEHWYDHFGVSVAGAGDVNGDGYGDIIAGANTYPYNDGQRGKAYLYYGTSTIPGGTAWAEEGEDWGYEFGISVAGAGDVNGDGYDDVLVGAYGYGGYAGKAYLYQGSLTGLSTTPSWSGNGYTAGERFGFALAGVGDVNGDGYDDVMIGADGYYPGSNYGRVYIYQGSEAGLSVNPDSWMNGENNNDRFGISVAGAGDVNGDSYADVLVGAVGYPSGANQGKVTLFHGSPDGLVEQNGWSRGASLVTSRLDHTATVLPDGKVLVVGGRTWTEKLNSAELYDPKTGQWTPTGSMNDVRGFGHTTTLLADGRVLVVGGGNDQNSYLSSAELYDPQTGTWTHTDSLNIGRNRHTATLLLDGRVLVAGGIGYNLPEVSSAELYDPQTGQWTTTGSMHVARYYHTATLLSGGQVLVAGGVSSWGEKAEAELYDPKTGQWALTASLLRTRTNHTASRLPDGRVLVAGGFGYTQDGDDYLAVSEIYDPASGEWTESGSLTDKRSYHSAVTLPDGRVLVVGGMGGIYNDSLSSVELYDPATGQWTYLAYVGSYDSQTANLLPDGRVLVLGSEYVEGSLGWNTLIYAPVWTATGVAAGSQFGLVAKGAGDTNGDGYSDLLVGAFGTRAAYVYQGSSGLSPTNVTVEDGEVSTLFLSKMGGSSDPLSLLQTQDAVFDVITTTAYVVDQAIIGEWSLNLIGDTLGASLQASAVAAPNPPVLDQLTVDASNLANTQLTYRLLSDARPVNIRMFANDGPISETMTFTTTEGIPEIREIALFQGTEVANLSLNDESAVTGAVITTTLDLSRLESGNYKLWVRAEDGISPPVQGYVWGTNTYTSGRVPAAWNRVQIAAASYDEIKQAEGAAEIVIDHTPTFAPSWATTAITEISQEGLNVEFTPYDHPDVDGYLLEIGELGYTHVMTTGNTVYYHTDENGDPTGDPIHYAAFKGLSPKHTYTLRIAALDLDHDLTSWSQEYTFSVPLGELTLSALEPSIEVEAGQQQVVTATLVMAMSENLFSDVYLTLDSYFLPPGLSLSGITYELAAGAQVMPMEGQSIPAPMRMPESQRNWNPMNATGSDVTVLAHVALTVASDLPAASYLLPFVAYSGELERRVEVRLVVGTPAGIIFDPASGTPLVLHGDLPLPSCATGIDVTIPANAFAQKTRIVFMQASSNVEDWLGAYFGGSHFIIEALAYNSGAPIAPLIPLSLDLRYNPACMRELHENGLHLRYWKDGTSWATDGVACTPNPANNALHCSLARVGEFALFEPFVRYLPLLHMNR